MHTSVRRCICARLEWFRKIYDYSIHNIMFMFCHHRSDTFKLSKNFCDSPQKFRFVVHLIFIIPISIDIQKMFGLPILSTKNVMLILKLINKIL